MDAQPRFGIALEPSTLLAADSFLRELRLSSDTADVRGAALAVDPAARDQFVRTVDTFLDTPAHYLITAKVTLPQPAPVSEALMATTVKVPDTVTKLPLDPSFQTTLCKQFLVMFHASRPLQLAALRWAAFQMLSADILQGYVIRMDMPFGQPLVNDAAKSAFTEAMITLEEPRGQSVLETAASGLLDLGLARLLSAPRSSFDSLGLRHLAVGASYLRGLMHEAEGYRDIAKRLALPADSDLACFLLAYLCLECVRGWQHINLLSQQRDAPDLVYLAHHIRSAFMERTCQKFTFTVVPPSRLYWWSWGNLLARSMELRPADWPVRRLSEVLHNLQSALKEEPISISVDSPKATTEVTPPADRILLLQHLARSTNIVSEGDEALDRTATWAPALGRLLAVLSADRICELLAALVGESTPGSLVSALRAGEAKAVGLFAGSSKPVAAPGVITDQAEKWLAGSRTRLGQLYPTWDSSLDDRIAQVALSPVWAKRQPSLNSEKAR